MYLFDVLLLMQENAELIKAIIFNVIMFIGFLLILHLVAKKLHAQVDAIERNTEYMKKDFRTIKQEFELTREHINTIKNNVDVSDAVYQSLYYSASTFKNELIMVRKNVLQLSAMGLIICKELQLREIVEQNWDKIVPYINDSRENYSAHPYDVQIYCIYIGSCLDLFLDVSDIAQLKTYAYHQGHLLSAYYPLIGLVIKEKYFATYYADLSATYSAV